MVLKWAVFSSGSVTASAWPKIITERWLTFQLNADRARTRPSISDTVTQTSLLSAVRKKRLADDPCQ